jgi:hypothetical protein
MGGQLEFATTQSIPTEWSAVMLIDHRPPTETAWQSGNLPKYPQDLVFSFYRREPALIRAVVLNPQTRYSFTDGWTKGVEIWTSLESASDGFTKAASATLRPEPCLEACDGRVDVARGYDPNLCCCWHCLPPLLALHCGIGARRWSQYTEPVSALPPPNRTCGSHRIRLSIWMSQSYESVVQQETD